LFHVDVAAVAKLEMGLDFRRHVRVEYTLEVVRDQLDDLLTMDRHARRTVLVAHVPTTDSPAAK
jgi:hypothetical protein